MKKKQKQKRSSAFPLAKILESYSERIKEEEEEKESGIRQTVRQEKGEKERKERNDLDVALGKRNLEQFQLLVFAFSDAHFSFCSFSSV